MRLAGVLRALGPIDLKTVRRDSMLRWMAFLPVFLGLLVRFGVPLVERSGLALGPYLPLVGAALALMAPMTYGMVIGFLLLDEKDDRTLTALQVTPLTVGDYLRYRIGIPCLLSVVMTVVALELSGLPTPGLGWQLWAAVAAAPLAPAFALFLAAFAANKVQGFALTKAAGIVNWPPIIAWFVHTKWQWAFGLCPTYWPAKLYWELARGERSFWWTGVVALAYGAALVAWLTRRFDRAVHR